MNDSLSCNGGSAVNVTDEREARSKFWIAAYTRPKSEKKAATELAKNPGIGTYAPTQVVTKQWSDRKKKVEVVVIPMVIFAEVSTDEDVLTIKKHPLILKVFALPGRKEPAQIPSKQIEQLKFMLNESEEPVEFVQGNFKVSDEVKVVRGHLAGLEGVIEKTSVNQTFIIVILNMLGGAKVKIEVSDIQPNN